MFQSWAWNGWWLVHLWLARVVPRLYTWSQQVPRYTIHRKATEPLDSSPDFTRLRMLSVASESICSCPVSRHPNKPAMGRLLVKLQSLIMLPRDAVTKQTLPPQHSSKEGWYRRRNAGSIRARGQDNPGSGHWGLRMKGVDCLLFRRKTR